MLSQTARAAVTTMKTTVDELVAQARTPLKTLCGSRGVIKLKRVTGKKGLILTTL